VRVEGVRVALVGPVNAGKSSLFNALLGRARALVHDRPGTTRDVVEVPMSAGGLELTLLDTAGERVTDDPVEAAGLALARSLVDEADLLVVVLRRGPDDEVERLLLQRTRDRRRVVVVNGIDRAGAPEVPGALRTSAVTGEGVEALREALVAALPSTSAAEGLQLASERQAERLGAVALLLEQAAEALPVAGPAAAADALTEALERVDELTGADTREDVLSALFARFCIGK
jgi:tRNA modification GTPase